MKKVEVPLDDEAVAALCSFGERVGVDPRDVLSVMVGLAEQERRSRAVRLAVLLEEALTASG